jgi:benzylsuccinate CoA-transferase BbsE subunit/naphthyl-2-methylsuccinate CoA transferase subunit
MRDEQVEEWEVFDDDKWLDVAYRMTPQAYETFCRIFERFTMKHDKLTLYERGQANRVAVSPVSNGKDLLENPQLSHRDFWKKLHHANLCGEVIYPGAPYELGDLKWRLGDPAPSLGQHTAEILHELGYSDGEIQSMAKEGIVHVG